MAARPILVIGAMGQLARALGRHHFIDCHPIVCRGRPDVDLTEPASLERAIAALSPAAVVNSAAYTAVDKAEEDWATAFAANAEGPERLAHICFNRQISLIHVSSDYVFDGASHRPYCESDPIAPLSVYGTSKAAGEAAIRQACPRHIILRTAWLYSVEGHNFLTTMLRLGAERDEISVVDDQQGTPTWVQDFAGAVVAILQRLLASGDETLWGTYHLTNRGATTWFGFANEIFRERAAAGERVPRLRAIPTAAYPTPARRPAYSLLDNTKVMEVFGLSLPPWQASLASCLSQCRLPSFEDKVT
jgi:dTDP-4-dehydrorhamnose reductase